jgi:hypothetical protein
MAQAEYKNKYPFQIFTLNITIFIMLVATLVMFVLPYINDIEEKKQLLLTKLQEKKEVMSKGVTFTDFSSLRTEKIKDASYENNIIKTI